MAGLCRSAGFMVSIVAVPRTAPEGLIVRPLDPLEDAYPRLRAPFPDQQLRQLPGHRERIIPTFRVPARAPFQGKVTATPATESRQRRFSIARTSGTSLRPRR